MPADANPASVEVLAANEAFYAAFTQGDVPGMAQLWASQLFWHARDRQRRLSYRDLGA